ncbi:MAG: hypothetical protein PCFJNLEI_01980 [Verrucomicrobiae bacterium]|nr:hypothetical protein [Verrucomicrobiae bacterium]
MSWIEPISTTISVAEITSKIVESSGRLKKNWERLLYFVQHGSLVIPMFGAGGVGKSTMSRIIAGENPLSLLAPYDESMRVESVALTGNIPGRILVAPGQEARIDRHWPELLEQLNKRKAVGLLNIVSYGYHSSSLESIHDYDVYKEGMSTPDFVRAYLEHRRKREVALLRELVVGLSGIRKPLWMMTVVNKQDLWWSNRDSVRKYYIEGEYSHLLDELTAKVGARNFQHEYLPASLTLGNFRTPAGEILAETCAGYDQLTHLRYYENLLNKVYELGAHQER